MKPISQLVVIFALLPSLCLAADNLFKNSTMDTSAAWRGDRTFETVDDNRVAVLKANQRKSVSLNQEVDTRGLKDVVLSFRYKTADYNGRGLQLRGVRQDGGSTYNNVTLKADDQWHDYSWRFSEVRGSNRIKFILELLEGSGTVLLDDVELTSQ